MIAIPPEGETLECKTSLGEWREIVETCAAFATAKGGRLFVGVAPGGTVCGVRLGKGTVEDLANKIAQQTNPRVVPSISTKAHGEKVVVVVEVRESPSKPVYAFDRPFRRSGRTNQRLSPSEASELYLESRGLTWDETAIARVRGRDVDPDQVRRFLHRAKLERRWEISPETPVTQALRQLGVIRHGQLTAAGLLLFGKDPQRLMPQAALRCARFKGDTTLNFLDLKVIEGDLIAQVEEAVAFVKRHISMAAEITDLERKERWEYPIEAIREAIVNAVCHRDYASSGNVQVRIFDHGLEVWNPGGLPPGLSIEDLRGSHESKPRNKLIARVFFLIRYIEQFGTGTRRMIADCLAARLPEPVFESRAETFRVVFQQPFRIGDRFAGLGLTERQLRALSHAVRVGRLSRQDYQRLTMTKPATAKRDLRALVKKGLLAKNGVTKSVWYEFVSQASSAHMSQK